MTSPVIVEKKKKIKLSYILNIVLLIIIVIGCIFGYLYYKSINPTEVMVNKIVPLQKVPKATFLYSIYRDNKNNVPLTSPQRVYVYNGRTYVSTGVSGRVSIFDENGKGIKSFTMKGKRFEPYGMTVVDNRLYVADAGERNIHIFDLDGKYIKDFAPRKIQAPTDMYFYNNKFYIIDSVPQCIRVFDKNGNEQLVFGKVSNKNKPKEKIAGEFYYPNGIGVDENKIYVADSDNSRIQVFDLKGKFIKEVYKDKKGDNIFNIPRGIAFDKNNNLYTANNMGHGVLILNEKPEVISSFSMGEKEGDSMNLPNGIFIDANSKAYVPEFSGNRVLVYQLK